MNRAEIAKTAEISLRHFDYILRRERRASPDVAKRLEKTLGIDRRAWVWPDEFPNPFLKNAPEQTPQ